MDNLTKIEKPYALLDDITKLAIKDKFNSGEIIQRLDANGIWVDDFDPAFFNELTYRVKPKTKPQIPWDAIVEDYMWAARDDSGDVYIYKNRPKIFLEHKGWIDIGIMAPRMEEFLKFDPGTCDWTDSLVSRLD
jgi:hypothetical protein